MFALPMIEIVNFHKEIEHEVSADFCISTTLKSAVLRFASSSFFFFLLLLPGCFCKNKPGHCTVGRPSSPVTLSDSLAEDDFSLNFFIFFSEKRKVLKILTL